MPLTEAAGAASLDFSGYWRLAAQAMLQQAMEAEVEQFVGRGRYERRGREQSTYRNGYNRRRVATGEGAVELHVPQTRDGTEPFQTAILDAYRRRSEGVSNDIDFALQFVQHRSGAGRRVHEQRFRLGDSPQVAGANILHSEVKSPLSLGGLHRLLVTLVEQFEDAVLLLDVQHHNAVEKLFDVARVAVPNRRLLLVQHAHSIRVAQAEPCVRVPAGFDLPV